MSPSADNTSDGTTIAGQQSRSRAAAARLLLLAAVPLGCSASWAAYLAWAWSPSAEATPARAGLDAQPSTGGFGSTRTSNQPSAEEEAFLDELRAMRAMAEAEAAAKTPAEAGD